MGPSEVERPLHPKSSIARQVYTHVKLNNCRSSATVLGGHVVAVAPFSSDSAAKPAAVRFDLRVNLAVLGVKLAERGDRILLLA